MSTDLIAAKNAFVLITNKFVIKTNAFFAAIASVLVMKFKALEQLIFGVVVQPRCVVGPRVSPAYFVDRGQATCTRMSMDIRVHIGRNPRSQHEG